MEDGRYWPIAAVQRREPLQHHFAPHRPLKGGGDATEPHCSSAHVGADAVDHGYQPISAR